MKKKLSLNKETLHSLDASQSGDVAAGGFNTYWCSYPMTACYCTYINCSPSLHCTIQATLGCPM